MNRSVSVRKIAPILLTNICVQAVDSVDYFSLKMLYDRLAAHPFVVHQNRVVYVQRCKPAHGVDTIRPSTISQHDILSQCHDVFPERPLMMKATNEIQRK